MPAEGTASFFIPLFYLLFLLVVQCLILVEEQFRFARTADIIRLVLFTFISFTIFTIVRILKIFI